MAVVEKPDQIRLAGTEQLLRVLSIIMYIEIGNCFRSIKSKMGIGHEDRKQIW